MTAEFALAGLDEDGRREYWAALALRHCPRLGASTAGRLLERFGSAYEALQQVSLWGEPDLDLHPDSVRAILSDKWRETARVEWDATRTLPGEIILWTDERYPPDLREIPDAPIFLYVRGDVSLLHNPCVAVVGTRKCSARGAHNAKTLAGGLAAAGLTVVSGLAMGVDGVAHSAALSLPGRTIAVLGTGLDVIYPAKHSQLYADVAAHGLLVSEFAPGTKPEPRNFPIRNRIISGLALGVLVVEASERSGSLLTAYLGIRQNRAVYAVAGEIGHLESEGCHKLIREGAQVVFCSGDILRDLSDILRARQDERMAIILPTPPENEACPAENEGHQECDACQEDEECLAEIEVNPAEDTVHTVENTVRAAEDEALPVASTPPEPEPAPAPQKPRPVRKKKAETTAPAHETSDSPPAKTPKKAEKEAPLGPRLILALADGPRSIDALCERLNVPVAQLSVELVMMEVRGNVKMLSNNTYSLI